MKHPIWYISLIISGVFQLTSASASFSDSDVKGWLDQLRYSSKATRLEWYSGRFIGANYGDDKLGEGTSGKYDQDPLYRFDLFDCTTFVETITALSISADFDGFTQSLDRIRYENAQISYTTRNHFPSLDWIPNNINAGIFNDITDEIGTAGGIAPEWAEAEIDKKTWYAKKQASQLSVSETDAKKRATLLSEWRHEGDAFEKQTARLKFLRITRIFEIGVDDVLANIPSGTIVNMVTPGWNIRDPKDGSLITQMNVSHQGIAIRKNDTLYLRHASQDSQKVVEVPFKDYLSRFIESRKVKGINLLEVR